MATTEIAPVEVNVNAVLDVKKGQDLIQYTSHEIENLNKEKAYELARRLAENVEFSYFQLGGILSVIQSHGWFHDEGYETFRDFVESEHGIPYRKAVYLIQIYNGLVESQVPWDKVKHLGWTKLKELANILTPDNLDEWLKRIEGMTVLQIQELIKADKSGTPATEEQDSTVTKVTTITFKVHDDQKEIIREAVEKAKGDANTDFDAVALEAICMQYLSGDVTKPGPDFIEEMESRGPEEVLNLFDKVFPKVEISVNVDTLK